MRLVHRLLCFAIVIVLLLVPAASAQGGPELEVDWMEDEEAIRVDGQLDEPVWQEAAHEQIELEGADDEDARLFAQLYVAHNGSALFVAVVADGAEDVTLQFAGDGGFQRATDALRAGDGGSEDLHWDTDEERFVADGDAEGCADNGTAAASDAVEFEKPFSGDDCDAFLAAGSAIALRVLVTTADGSYAWPGGSAEDETGDWARVTLNDRFGDADEDIGRGPEETPYDPRLETGPGPGVDPNAPPAPGVDTDNPAYNAESERETPGPGWLAVILVGLAGLALAAGLRRSG